MSDLQLFSQPSLLAPGENNTRGLISCLPSQEILYCFWLANKWRSFSHFLDILFHFQQNFKEVTFRVVNFYLGVWFEEYLGVWLRPRPRWGLPPPDPLLNGVWGGAPTGSRAEPQRGLDLL